MEVDKNDGLGSDFVEEKSGVGLPYAPVDWPNPGDVWTWKVGKRISMTGFYRDRFIFPPKRLHRKGQRNYFDSKKIIIAYLRSEFPETDVDAFFKSFTWKVPANFNKSGDKVDTSGALSSGELHNLAQTTPRSEKVQPRSKSEKNAETEFRRRSWRLAMSKSSLKKRIRFSPKEVKDVIDLSSWSNGTGSCESTADNSESATDSEYIRASASQNTGSQSPKAGPVNDQSATSQEKMFEARKKLLLLLATDNHVLLSSIKLPEIMHLLSLLKSDPNIDANPDGILKLIDEIPLAWKKSQENKKISEAASKFSEDHEINIACATKLDNEFNESKGQENILHKELDSISLYIEKIDEQINALQLKRADLARTADVKKKVVDMLISKQKQAAECLSKVVDEIEMGKKRRLEWELKKKISEEQKGQDPLQI